MSTTGDTEQPHATVTSTAAPAADSPAHGLEWQSELDSALIDLDVKLSHPRRRASDKGAQPSFPELGRAQITNELLDEIAWRVAEQLRRNPPALSSLDFVPPVAVEPEVLAHAAAVAAERKQLRSGIVLTIRVRRPLFHFRWRFWRRSRGRQAMMLFSDYRVS